MTKREKIIKYLVDGGIRADMLKLYEDSRWPKSGTVVVSGVLDDDWRTLYFKLYKDVQNPPITIRGIRVRLEWQYGCYRIFWIGD